MYKLHLILKYLRKRRIAWVSLAAVVLCTAMVLVVISVMGGWLRMFRESFRGLSGDVLVEGQAMTGFPYYQEMIERIEKLPEVEAAVPVIQTFGLVKVDGLDLTGVQVMGYPIDRIGRVNAFPESLFRQGYGREEALESLKELRNLSPSEIEQVGQKMAQQKGPSFDPFLPAQVYQRLATTQKSDADASQRPGMIVGAGVVGIRKGPANQLINRTPLMYEAPATLTVVAVQPGAARADKMDTVARPYWVVDDSRTKVYEYDQKSVYVPFDALQGDLDMREKPYTENGVRHVDPARTSSIHVHVKAAVPLIVARDKIAAVVDAVLNEKGAALMYPPLVQTWEQRYATFIGAVEKEKLLLLFLFGIISIVAIFLIFCIFYMIVVEKTRDIGIIKSVGATSSGVAGIFLGYGLAIGVVGAGLGLLIGYLIVHNINELHAWLGRALNITIWNPEVYLFDTIPNTMNPREVFVIVAVAILASVAGALVPAIRAARMHPVEALRWE